MAGFKQVAKILGKAAQEAVPAVKTAVEGAERFMTDEAALTKELNRINDRRAAAGDFPLTSDQLKNYYMTKEVPKEPMVSASNPKMPKEEPIAALPTQDGPTTLTESNKLYNPEMSGKINYKPKKAGGLMPLGAAAQGLYEDLQNSSLGDVATRWEKIKKMVSDPLAKQLDLSGGKDKQFQEQASGVLSAVADPTNFIPGAGGVITGAAQMLAKDPDEAAKKELLKKKMGMP